MLIYKLNLIFLFADMSLIDLAMATSWYRKKRIVLPLGILVNVLAGLEAYLEAAYINDQPLNGFFLKWMQLSPPYHFIISTFLLVNCVIVFLIEGRINSTSITRTSVQTAINEMDTGLMFAFPTGGVALINKKMEKLATEILGRYPKDCSRFFSKLVSFTDTEKVKKVNFTAWPTFLFEDGEVWTFEREIIKDSDVTYIEIIAKNITTLYEQRLKLEEDNNRLKELQTELSKVLTSISEAGNDEELLHYKMRIHDQLGNAILRTRTYLRDPNLTKQYVEEILFVWENTIKAFEENLYEAKPSEEGSFAEVLKQAEAFGLELTIKGRFPTDNALAVRAVREAMYNSIRHAYANHMMVDSYKAGDGYHIRISDDGIVKDENITEGGGLTSLRKAIEEAGGSMTVGIWEGLELSLFIPSSVG